MRYLSSDQATGNVEIVFIPVVRNHTVHRKRLREQTLLIQLMTKVELT